MDQVQGYPQLHWEFKDSLGYVTLSQKTTNALETKREKGEGLASQPQVE